MRVWEVGDALSLKLLFDCSHAPFILRALLDDTHVLLVEMPALLEEQAALLLVGHVKTLFYLTQHFVLFLEFFFLLKLFSLLTCEQLSVHSIPRGIDLDLNIPPSRCISWEHDPLAKFSLWVLRWHDSWQSSRHCS